MTDTGIHCDPLLEETDGEGEYVLTADYTRDTIIGPITVPAGYITDFASIPRIARWLFPQSGRFSIASLLHDYILARGTDAQRRQVTRVFNDELKKAGAFILLRWIAVAFVFVATSPEVYLSKVIDG